MECFEPGMDEQGQGPLIPSATPVVEEPPAKCVAVSEYPTPSRAPIGLQILQNKEKDSTDGLVKPKRTGSGGQIHRKSGVQSAVIEEGNPAGKDKEKKAKQTAIVSKYSLSSIAVDEVLSELELRWKRVKDKKDLTKDVDDDFEYFAACAKYSDRKSRRILVQCMHNLGLVQLMTDVWDQNFSVFIGKDSDLSGKVYNNMKFIMVVMWNTTDLLDETCEDILETGFYKDIFNKYLDTKELSPPGKKGFKASYLTKGLMGILHNMLQRSDARDKIRAINGVEIMVKYRESTNENIRTKTEILLAYLIDEKQNDMLNSDDKTFKYLLTVLTDCLDNGKLGEGHYSKKYGYNASEVLAALKMLAASDSNKEKIVNNGALPLLVKAINPLTSTPEEQLETTTTLWNLSFLASARREIQKEPGCIEGLQNLLTEGGSTDVKRAVFGALWTLKIKPKRKETDIFQKAEPERRKKSAQSKEIPTHAHPEEEIDKDKQHIFISYNWGSKPTMLTIRDRLKSLGYNVWMDVDNMSGSILEAMALAVENAAVVVVCLSSKYKESPNCRTEGEYAFKKRKPIVPLRLEHKYLPDGWLGALVGNSLFFDISSKDKLEINFEKFVKELGDRGKLSTRVNNGAIAISPSIGQDQSALPSQPSRPKSEAEKWGTKDVQKWLIKIGIKANANRFVEFDGNMLLEYKNMLRDAPEFFYKSLKEDMGMSLPSILKFTKSLKNLD